MRGVPRPYMRKCVLTFFPHGRRFLLVSPSRIFHHFRGGGFQSRATSPSGTSILSDGDEYLYMQCGTVQMPHCMLFQSFTNFAVRFVPSDSCNCSRYMPLGREDTSIHGWERFSFCSITLPNRSQTVIWAMPFSASGSWMCSIPETGLGQSFRDCLTFGSVIPVSEDSRCEGMSAYPIGRSELPAAMLCGTFLPEHDGHGSICA